MSNIEQAAIEATFHLQLNTRDAVAYVQRQTKTDARTAEQAITAAVTHYKKR